MLIFGQFLRLVILALLKFSSNLNSVVCKTANVTSALGLQPPSGTYTLDS